MDLSVLIPAYNEAGSIRAVLDDLLGVLPKSGRSWEIIVIDDHSTDRTAEIVTSIASRHKKIRLVRHPYNKGYGASLKTGATAAKGEWLMFYDADNQFFAQDVLRLLKHIPEHDLVIGARKGQKSVFRAPGKILLTSFAGYLAGSRIPDLNCGLRVMRKTLFERFRNLYPERFSITSTITMAGLKNGYNVRWVKLQWKPRRTGNSRVRVVRDGLTFLLLVTRLTMLFSPLRVFIPVAIVLFLLGGSYGLYTAIAFENIGDFSTLTTMSGLFVVLFGLVADQLANIRRELSL